jgi:DNA-binding NtrC family response regulator
VLLVGPSGCGKERVAEIIQATSRRRGGPFVRVNVGALPEELMESELFGAEAGAYTGLKGRRTGRFETAHGGTLLLDEIDALSLSGQVKLLRVLQSGEYQRLGSSTTRHADVRILSATNADLGEAIAAKRFRQDLYFRLNVVELVIPPLSERRDDIQPLARHFLEHFSADRGRPLELSRDAEAALAAYPWPGNVRELENRIQRATLVAVGDVLTAAHLDLDPAAAEATGWEPMPARTPATTQREAADPVERERLVNALNRADGVIAHAAEELGVSRQALYRRMQKLGVQIVRRPNGRHG